ncbi:MAG: tRNA1(Val) (adenine(37)-N6)-methyltransferase [Caulobacteraceae bacterium]
MVKTMHDAEVPDAPPVAAPDADAAAGEVTQGTVLGGRVILRQPRVGYRAGLDAALLAASVEARPGERAIEAGCGVGGALLQAAARQPDVHFTGVERDGAALALARENIGLNTLADRVEVRAGDVELAFSGLGLAPFDLAFSNPPFFDDETSLRGPHPSRRGAYIADGGLAAWARFLLKAVRPGGRITVVHRADRLADLLGLLGEGGGSFRIRPVQPFADAPAKRVLVRAIKTGKAPLVLLPPLVLHDRDGAKHTPLADALLRGETALDWS